MDYFSIEKYFTDNKLKELLDIYKEDFALADEYANLFTNNALIAAMDCQEALDVLTGLFMKFNIVYHIADYYHEKVHQMNKKIGENETLHSLDILRIKNIFKMYMDGVRKAITSSQSLLKYYIKEMELTK